MGNRTSRIAATLVLALLTLPFAGAGRAAQRNAATVHLQLQISKRRYRVGEPITVLAYLENRGTTFYYVGATLAGFWGTLGLHEMHLRITNERNQDVPIGHGGGSWIWKPNSSVTDKIAQAYVQLAPGGVWGQKDQIPLRLPAGRYRITATYREIEAQTWTAAERGSLPLPVWVQPLTSNTVVIQVTR